MYVDIKFTVIFQGARVDISVKAPSKPLPQTLNFLHPPLCRCQDIVEITGT